MISDARIRTLARQDGVTAGLAEKNYVNSWVLYAIYTSDVGKDLVFKGGTALSKLYCPDVWRFSEDLDFTAQDQHIVPSDIEVALNEIEATSGIQFEMRNVHQAIMRVFIVLGLEMSATQAEIPASRVALGRQ